MRKGSKSGIDPREQGRLVGQILKRKIKNPRCELNFSNPFELLIATILAAQCTDERVNAVTRGLFTKYPNPQAFAMAPLDEIETEIRSTGFYKSKARSIKKCCESIVARHGGEVPANMDDLLALGGVGRKTANVVLGNAFGIPGIIVDTHVQRVAGRLGLTKNKNPEKIEEDLMKIVPRKDWTLFSNLLVLHGRYMCKAKVPLCRECPLNNICPSAVL